MDDQLKLAFQFAADMDKQLIALATGILGLSITFVRDVVNGAGKRPNLWLILSWSGYFVTILSGIWCLMALTGQLVPSSGETSCPELNFEVQFPAEIQVVSFVFATLAAIIFGWKSLQNRNALRQAKNKTRDEVVGGE